MVKPAVSILKLRAGVCSVDSMPARMALCLGSPVASFTHLPFFFTSTLKASFASLRFLNNSSWPPCVSMGGGVFGYLGAYGGSNGGVLGGVLGVVYGGVYVGGVYVVGL